MSKETAKRVGVAFGLIAFILMVLGSVLLGSTVITALLRGVMAAFIFGPLVWGMGSLIGEVELPEEMPLEEEIEEEKGENLDETA